MVKSLHNTLKALLLMAFLVCPASFLMAQEVQQSSVEMEQNHITIAVNGFNLRVKNAEGLVLEIFSLTGEKVYTQHIESASKAVNLSQMQSGYYLVKIGNFTRKIYLHK
ncbi:MAG: T9SS type A sorting domain-containing protein [Bacteroidaceae bacterium]|nr:T9SS type A sorting domain-containing protein [Bacteroidaceae bacterium]